MPAASPVEPTSDPNVPAGFMLGWRIAEVYRGTRSRGGQRPSDETLGGPARMSAARASVLGLDQLQVTLLKLQGLIASAGLGQPDMTAIREALTNGHIDEHARHAVLQHAHEELFSVLHAADERVGKAYDLGRALGDTCHSPGNVEDVRRTLEPHRILVLSTWLRELTTVLPVHVSRSVRLSLESWTEWVRNFDTTQMAISDRSVVQTLRAQGDLWRALLAGDTAAVDMLERDDYRDVNARLNLQTRRMIVDLMQVYWLVVLIVVVVLAGSVALIVTVKNSAAGIAAVAGVLSSLGLGFKSIGLVTEIREPLFNQELEVAIARRITILPRSDAA